MTSDKEGESFMTPYLGPQKFRDPPVFLVPLPGINDDPLSNIMKLVTLTEIRLEFCFLLQIQSNSIKSCFPQ